MATVAPLTVGVERTSRVSNHTQQCCGFLRTRTGAPRNDACVQLHLQSVGTRKPSEGITLSRIIIGVDRSERSQDAVAFGRMLAQASGAPVTVVSAYPYEPAIAPATSSEHGEFLREGAEATLERMSDPLRDRPGLETRSVADRSLQGVASEQDAGVIVVGSSHIGRVARVLPGSTAERLLHGPPARWRSSPSVFAQPRCESPV